MTQFLWVTCLRVFNKISQTNLQNTKSKKITIGIKMFFSSLNKVTSTLCADFCLFGFINLLLSWVFWNNFTNFAQTSKYLATFAFFVCVHHFRTCFYSHSCVCVRASFTWCLQEMWNWQKPLKWNSAVLQTISPCHKTREHWRRMMCLISCCVCSDQSAVKLNTSKHTHRFPNVQPSFSCTECEDYTGVVHFWPFLSITSVCK